VEPAHRAADGGIGRLIVPVQYCERAPHPGLVDDIACTWSGAARAGMRILPDGCIDIVWIGDEALTVAGPDTSANLAGLADGTLTVGVRFRSGRAPGFLGVAAHELTDRSVSLEDVWGAEACHLAERLAAAATVESKQAVLEQALLGRLDHVERPHPDVDAALGMISASPSSTRVAALSRQLDVSERHLRRRFEQAVGYGPKTLGRVLRFRRFLSLVEHEGHPLAWAAAEAGYADQPHLTRECNDLAGLPPAELLAGRNVQDAS
jgi:AraC-like DNA-binding protein